MNIASLYEIFISHPCIQTDSRKVKPGDLFFALKGDRFNGNLFAQQALEAGAVACIVDEDTGLSHPGIIKVENVLTTLQQLARHHRLQFNIPVLAITGSNGKTTTKELIHAVLSTKYKTYTTEGNLNNHIGIPLTLLKIGKDAEIAVVEMGANHQKEIESYCLYTLPTHGLITNVGKAHLEGFGGIEGVKKGKGELFDYLRTDKGTVFICKDYDYFEDMSKGIGNRITYGTQGADVTGQLVSAEPFLKVRLTGRANQINIHTQLVGAYNLPNVLAAVAVGKYFNVADDDIQHAIEAYTPSNSRSQMVIRGTNRIILDAYNANPSSMRSAIENFALQHSNNKILILGAMMELGDESEKEHQQIIELIHQYPWQQVVLVGNQFPRTGHSFLWFANSAEARNWFTQQSFINALILIKGSRSTAMEKVVAE